MKKSVVVGGLLVLVAAVSLFFYFKKPSTPASEKTAVSTSDSADDKDPGWSNNSDSGTRKLPATLPLFPGETLEQKSKEVDSFLSHSGTAEAFGNLNDKLSEELQLTLGAQDLSDEERNLLEQLKEKLNGERLMAEYKNVLSTKFTTQELQHLSQIYQDPDMQRLRDSQAYNVTKEGQKELAKYVKNFNIKNLPADRRAALEAFTDNQMKMFPNDLPMFNSMGEDFKKQMLKAARAEMIAHSAHALEKDSVEHIQGLSKKFADPILQREGIEKAGFMAGVMSDIFELATPKN